MTSRKPTAGFWITVALVAVVVGYPLSAGPVSYLLKRGMLPASALGAARLAYAPLRWMHENGPEMYRASDKWYMDLWEP